MRQNLGLKIFALALALIVWVQITLMAEHKTTVNLKVSVENLPEGVIMEDTPQTLPFQVRGKGLDILRLRLANVQVRLDAGALKPGSDLLSLQDYTVTGLPEDVEIQLSGPAQEQQISVTTDVLHQKTVPVQIRFENDDARRLYERDSYTFSPEKIVISGAKAKLQQVRIAETIPITSAMLKDQNFNLDLALPLNNIRSSVSQVNVTRVRTQTRSRIIEDIPIRAENKAQYLPPVVTIKIEGEPRSIDKLKAVDIIITPTPEPDAEGWHSLQVQLPEGIGKYAITPTKVRTRQ